MPDLPMTRMPDLPMTRAQGIEQLIRGATMDNGLGPALDYEQALPAFVALGVTVAEVDAACDRTDRQSWRDMGKLYGRFAAGIIDAEPADPR